MRGLQPWRRALLAALLAALTPGAPAAAAAAAAPAAEAGAHPLPPPPPPPPEFSGTVYVGGLGDLTPYSDGRGGAPASRCQQVVDSATGFNMRRLQFLVSQSWVDAGPLDLPPGWDGCVNASLSKYYCFSRFNSTRVQFWSYERGADGQPLPVTAAALERFAALLGACLSHAAALGFDLAINVHADDGRQAGGWRNTLDFNPLEPFGGFSYADAFMAPIASALASAMGPTTRAWLSLQGEMGATVFLHPREWVVVAEEVRARLAGAGGALASNPAPGPGPTTGAPSSSRVKLGLGINNSKLCGCVLADVVNYDEYLLKFDALWPSIEGWFDMEGLREAFAAVDYVGISAYVPQASTNFSACDMERLMEKMDLEFGYYNLTLKELQQDMGKEIQWIEFGIGGGVSQSGDQIATTATQAAQTPFFGIYTPYRPDLDPWGLSAPAAPNEVRDYMHYYYAQTSRYLAQGGCNYQVAAAYLWNLASWDVIGLYPDCSSGGGCRPGPYQDPWVVDLVRRHNAAVHSLEGGGWRARAPAPELEPALAAAG